MSSAAQTIKDRLGIVDVLESYIKLEKAGANYKGRCPFHNEKTPSFYVSPARNSYYCFGCAAKGDIFTFVQEFEKVDFVGALKILAERAGVPLESLGGQMSNQNEVLYKALELSTTFFESQLSKNKKALQYLKDRGLNDESIKAWRLGLASSGWRELHDYLSAVKKVPDIVQESAGLVKRSEKEQKESEAAAAGSVVESNSIGSYLTARYYDRFRSRIMFPMFDQSGRVIAYSSGRIFGAPEDSFAPKYLNSPDTPVFNKSDVLYGIHKAKEGIRTWGYAIIVEGQMDLLMCHQAGFNNTVATSGTSLTIHHLERIKKHAENIMLVYDADSAGEKATRRAWEIALSIGLEVKVAFLPKGEDPASCILKDKNIFRDALKGARHIVEYTLDSLFQKNLPEKQLHKQIEEDVLELIASVQSNIEKDRLLSMVNLKTSISFDTLRLALKQAEIRIKENQRKEVAQQSSVLQNEQTKYQLAIDTALRRVASLIVWLSQEEPVPQVDADSTTIVATTNASEDLLNDLNEKFDSSGKHKTMDRIFTKKKQIIDRAELLGYIKTSLNSSLPDTDVSKIYSLTEDSDQKESMLFEADIFFNGNHDLKNEIRDIIVELEERSLKERLSHTMNRLHVAEKNKDTSAVQELIALCQDLTSKLGKIKKNK